MLHGCLAGDIEATGIRVDLRVAVGCRQQSDYPVVFATSTSPTWTD